MDFDYDPARDAINRAKHGVPLAFNMWSVIWPAQKGLGLADADTKARAAVTAMIFSRTNTLLSIAMLYCMISAESGF